MRPNLNIWMRLATVFAACLMSLSVYAAPDGVWAESPAGLPYCRYDGNEGEMDFLLGNYRMNVITHSNGIYEILSGERVWARFNADPVRPDYGKNRATLTMGRKTMQLVGENIPDDKKNKYEIYTGVGFTRYDYKLKGGLKCSRMISVLPSESLNGGYPCFVITVTLTNTGGGTKTFTYEEVFSPMYMPVADQRQPSAERAFSYPMTTEISFRCLKAYFMPKAGKFMHMPSPITRSRYEVTPQSIFLYSSDAFLSIADGEFKAQYFDMKLKGGETRVLNIVVGLSFGDNTRDMAEAVLRQGGNGQFGAFEAQWKEKLPNFQYEKNRSTRRDMFMNLHSLEASAVYDSYFDETFIPAESGKVYSSGENLSNRDHLQCALPFCYTNPEFAKSVMRYVMKHAEADGRIYGGNTGYGYIPSSYRSGYYDLQVHFLHLLSEYLRITGDYAFLNENVTLYSGEIVKVMAFVERCFTYLRDDIPSEADRTSVLINYSLASSYFPELAIQMKESGIASEEFVKAIDEYSDWAWDTFRKSDGYLEEEHDSNDKSMALFNYLRALES